MVRVSAVPQQLTRILSDDRGELVEPNVSVTRQGLFIATITVLGNATSSSSSSSSSDLGVKIAFLGLILSQKSSFMLCHGRTERISRLMINEPKKRFKFKPGIEIFFIYGQVKGFKLDLVTAK